jgi:hypothetical protein
LWTRKGNESRAADDVRPGVNTSTSPPLFMPPVLHGGAQDYFPGQPSMPTPRHLQTAIAMEEIAISSRLTAQEKLLVSQAVYSLGAVNWEKISEILENHPVIEGRPKEWFDAATVEAYYVGLMTEIGINVYVFSLLIS